MVACLAALAVCQALAQTDPYKPPLYWSTYEYNIVRQHFGVSYNYIPEYELQSEIDWVDANLKKYGYNMIEIDGWGDSLQLNENGYRTSHSKLWLHDFAYWSAYLQKRGMTLGMYMNPLWIHVPITDTHTKIVGTDINVSSLIDPSEVNTNFTNANSDLETGGNSPESTAFVWADVERPGAEQYVKGYVKFYADMGVKFIRIDFMPWYESGVDHYLGKVGKAHGHNNYETALRWIREACDQYGVYLSLAMANMFNEGEVERKYVHMVRIDEDVDYGEWWKFSDKDRGHRFDLWSQWANAMDGFTYWSYISGRNKIRLDGDFIRMNTYATDSERRSVASGHFIAGGPVGVADQYNTIGDSIWVYQNPELIALNADAFVGKPLTNDPTNEASQTWSGQMSNGDTIVAFFNRETSIRNRTLTFSDIGVSGTVSVRDLWQHASMGQMNSISVDLPAHGSMVLRLSKGSSSCRPQSITFNKISDWSHNDPPPALSATASSGLPVVFEVALGPATVEGNKLHPTDQPGTIFVQAKQSGNASWCAAIPQAQSLNATGVHQENMFLFGTFTSWTPIRMKLVGDNWVAERISLPAGTSEFKFANTNNFSGRDWGNGEGIAALAMDTTGGKPNSQIMPPHVGFYRVTFNDVTLQYVWEEMDPAAHQ